MKTNLISAVRLTLFCALFFSGVYMLAILGIAQLAPGQGKGIVVEKNGQRFHRNVAQAFVQDKYFWPRPSAVDYNAAGSGGSNKGPSNPEYLELVKSRIDTFLLKNPGVSRAEVPSEMVTASGSGLDPDISVAAAKIQAARVARARGIAKSEVLSLIDKQTEQPLLNALGTPKINVLELNLALDNLKS